MLVLLRYGREGSATASLVTKILLNMASAGASQVAEADEELDLQ